MSEDIPGFIYQIETYIKDLDDPTDMVKETLQYQGIRTNQELRDEYKKKRNQANAKKLILLCFNYNLSSSLKSSDFPTLARSNLFLPA